MNIFNPRITLNFAYYINNIVYSTLNIFNHVSTLYHTYINNVKYIKRLETEKILLEQQIHSLQSLNIDNIVLTQENKELKLLLSIVKNSDIYNFKNLITTKIFSKNLSNNTAICIIKAGIKDGVKDNLAVIAHNALVGRTISTTNEYSKIILLTNNSSRIPVYTKQNNLNAVVIGNNTNYPTLISYDKAQFLKEGDTILTSGLGGIFPRNIPVGTIYKNNDIWLVKPFNNFNNLLYVHIINLNTIK